MDELLSTEFPAKVVSFAEQVTKTIGKSVLSVGSSILNGVQFIVKSSWDLVFNSLSFILLTISNVWNSFWGYLMGIGSNGIQYGWSTIYDGFHYLWRCISDWVVGVYFWIFEASKNSVSFVYGAAFDGLKLGGNTLYAGALNIFEKLCVYLGNFVCFMSDCAIYLWELVFGAFYFIWQCLVGWIWAIGNQISGFYVLLSQVAMSGASSVNNLFVFSDESNETSKAEEFSWLENEKLEKEMVDGQESSKNPSPAPYQMDSSYLTALHDRIAALENALKLERARKNSEYELAIGGFNKLMSEQRLQADMALRKCCRWPCRSTQPALYDSFNVNAVVHQMEDLLAALKTDTSAEIAQLRRDVPGALTASKSLDADLVRRIVDDAIKIYNADKTGRADYALESAGGRVVSIRCTKAYTNRSPSWSWFQSIFSSPGGPQEAIRPGTSPGECWAFQGAVGQLALELSYPVTVTGFTLEHIAKELNPSGTIDSAPQHFSVWGLKHADDLTEQYLFGEYTYLDNGETVQYFQVQNPSERPYKFIELKIVSNHGHPDYTCLYRIRVHGTVT